MRNISLLAVLFSFVLVFFCSTVSAQTIPAAPQQYFSDYSGKISAADSARLESQLVNFNAATNAHFAVVVLPNLQGVTIEDFAEQLFRKWGIGEKGKDNGLLLLIALEDRQLRYEVGYGLEPFLTDAQTGGIIRNTIAPQFKQEAYAEGISRAIVATESILTPYAGEIASPSGTFKVKTSGLTGEQMVDLIIFGFFIGWPLLTYTAAYLARSKSFWAGGLGGIIIGIIFGIFLGLATGVLLSILLGIVGLLLDFLLSRNYTYLKSKGIDTGFRNSWGGFRSSGSSGGSSFGGFSGGSSGGGGSSGRW